MIKENTKLSYTKKPDYIFLISSWLILFFTIFIFKFWYHLGFNILFIGYFLTGEIRLATVFYAVIIRIILYPSALIDKFLEKGFKQTGRKFSQIETINDVFEKNSQKKSLLNSKRATLLYSWFHLCFLTMNAVTIGAIFFQNFTEEKLKGVLYSLFYLPKKFPINTTGYIPLIGNVNLSQPNMTLNLYSAIGAGIVGLVEVVLNKKIKRKQLIKYIIFFPLGAYYLTYWVPSGFEFTLVVFESLTILIIIVENIFKSKLFNLVKGTPYIKNEKTVKKEIKKEDLKQAMKELIAETSSKEV